MKQCFALRKKNTHLKLGDTRFLPDSDDLLCWPPSPQNGTKADILFDFFFLMAGLDRPGMNRPFGSCPAFPNGQHVPGMNGPLGLAKITISSTILWCQSSSLCHSYFIHFFSVQLWFWSHTLFYVIGLSIMQSYSILFDNGVFSLIIWFQTTAVLKTDTEEASVRHNPLISVTDVSI